MQKCSTTLNWFLNTQKKSILCNFIMKRHPETHSCRVNAHQSPHEWTPWTAGVGAPLSVTYTPLLILSPGCHVPISAILATAWRLCAYRSYKGEVKIRKISPRHEFLLELGCNSHPQSWPSHITSPGEEAQAPRASRRDHLASSSPVPCGGSSLHPLQLCLPWAHVSVPLDGKPHHEPEHSLCFCSPWLRFQLDQFLCCSD